MKAGDWLALSDRALLERLSDRWPAQDLDGEGLGWTSLLTSRLTTVRRGRTTIARAALHVLPLHIAKGVITVGGMRAMVVHHVAGVFLGDTSAARRDEARPLAAFEELKTWAREQAESWATSEASGHHLHILAGVLNFCGLSPGSLPVALSRSGWMSTRQLNRWVESRSEVYLTYFGEGDVALGDTRYLTGKTLPNFEIGDNVIAIVFEDALTGPSERFQWVFRGLFWGEDKKEARPGAYDKMSYIVEATIRMAWDLDKGRQALDYFCFVDREDHALGTHDGDPVKGFAIRYQRPPA